MCACVTRLCVCVCVNSRISYLTDAPVAEAVALLQSEGAEKSETHRQTLNVCWSLSEAVFSEWGGRKK